MVKSKIANFSGKFFRAQCRKVTSRKKAVPVCLFCHHKVGVSAGLQGNM